MNNENNVLPDNPSINVIKAGQSGIFTNYIYKAIPLAFDESMSYYETLLGLLNYLQNVILPTVNNNADAVAELQNLYIELKNYVEHYFDNLDVQEEINNKLDDMVEQGTLQEIIADYLNSKAIFGFDNVESMKNATNLINGSYAQTLGYYSKNDGGGALYKIRTITNDDVVDEMFIIELADNSLIGELIIDNEINAHQVGIKSQDNLDQTTKISNLITKSINKKVNIYIPEGIYCFSGTITIPETQYGIKIKGASGYSTQLKALTNTSQLYFTNFLRWNISDLYFKGTGQEEIPLVNVHGVANVSEFNNCFFASNMGLKVDNSAYLVLNHCSFTIINGHVTNYQLNVKGEYFYANNCYFEASSSSLQNSKSVIITHGQQYYFNNCDFCNWNNGMAFVMDSSNGSIKGVHVTKSTFVRNEISIQSYCDNGITNIELDDNDFIFLSGNELKIFNNERRSGTTGILNYIKGTNFLDGNMIDTSKQMFTANGLISNCKLGYSSSVGYPDYDNGFRLKIYSNFPNSVVISPESGQTSKKIVISNNSPFKDFNLPTITPIKYNGLQWQSYEVSNTYHGELSITFNYAGTGAYTEAYYKLSDY